MKKVNDADYIGDTPDIRKSQRLYHINMLKKYKSREPISVSNVACVVHSVHTVEQETECDAVVNNFVLLCNSDVLHNLEKKLCHLSSEREEMIKVITEFTEIFSNVPGRAKGVPHNVDVGNAEPIKQNPYHVNPRKLEFLRKEVDYMLEQGITESSQSNWSSPCLLVPKNDGSYCFCIDYRKVNSVTRLDSYPIPRVEDCIDRIGRAK